MKNRSSSRVAAVMSGSAVSPINTLQLELPNIAVECPIYVTAISRCTAPSISTESTMEGECSSVTPAPVPTPGSSTPGTSAAVRIDELDSIQWEVERLLACVNKRALLLTAEISGTPLPPAMLQEKKAVVKVVPGKPLALTISMKRQREDEHEGSPLPPKRRVKEASGSGTDGKQQSGKLRRPSPRGDSVTESSSSPGGEGSKLPKSMYEIPNRFWALMEPFCAEISEDNIKVLEDMIRAYDDDEELYRVPPLGEPPGSKWIKEEPDSGVSRAGRSGTSGSSSSSASSSRQNPTEAAAALLRKVDSEMQQPMDESSALGPVTRHLVSSLIEENIMTPLSESMEPAEPTDHRVTEAELEARAALPTKVLAKQLRVSNSYKLEKKLKKELERHGILPANVAEEEDELEDDPEDEVLAALKTKQRELRRVSEFNQAALRKLYQAAKQDMQRQEIRRRLAVADADVIEAYNKLQAYRQKRKVPLKKDRDVAWRALKDRAKIIKELEAFDSKAKFKYP